MTRRFLPLLALGALLLAAACPSDPQLGPADAPAPGDALGDADPGGGGGPPIPVGAPCVSSDECPGQFCDKRHGGCVDCYLSAHCADGQTCASAICVPDGACGAGIGCDPGVCDPARGLCVECLVDADCAGELVCVGQVCRPPYADCDALADCAGSGAVCLEPTGEGAPSTCGDCEVDSQCGDYEQCSERTCAPAPCFPGIPSCVGKEIQICKANGQGYDKVLCAEGQTCFAGACVENECTPPGTQTCEKFQLKICQDDGTLLTHDCPLGQECVGEACEPMRHRVLVVFDTSGSMNWFPGTNTWITACGVDQDECCLEPWPACEVKPACTVLGKSKEAFTKFFALGQTEQVLFGLQRFPQVQDRVTPSCEGGYYSWQNEITGDDGSYTVPLGLHTWFDEYQDEVILVPFPPSGSSATANLLELSEYMDDIEFVIDTDEPCSTHDDCDSGACLGTSVVGKTCRIFANPELRAEGATPLGKSLFYSGEYMRRHVVIDGKPCETDAECDSPGYFCGESGKCFDPHRQCRLNVILLFTDGGETEHPFTTDYFNPAVQAKRMRQGLGCQTDADCSQLDVCFESEDAEIDGCHQVYCHPQGKYCSYDVLDGDAFGAVQLVAPGADRLLDYNGNPIEVMTTVVDASLANPDASANSLNANRVIALNGGGRHVVVQVDDLDDFLNQLKKTIDFKQLFLQCTQQGAVAP